MLSTSEAARMLGISQRRVTSLIESGQLKAERIGRTWAVDETSVANRLASKPKPGRPSKDAASGQVRAYTLMCRNDRVLEFSYHHGAKRVVKLGKTYAVELAPIGACVSVGRVSELSLDSWISDRYIPSNRIGVDGILRRAGVSDTSELLFKSLGLNLTDQYWFKPQGVELDWHGINYFENPYVSDRDGIGPGSGTPGMLEKWWELKDGKSFLVKAGSHGEREPYAEVLATRMYERLLQPRDYVAYSLEVREGKPYSVCPSFIASDMQLVPLRDVFSCYAKPTGEPYDYKRYVRICDDLGIEGIERHLAKTIVCDFLDANIDRHDLNLGLIRNVDTLRFIGPAPLFDNGRCFYFEAQRRSDLGNGIYFHASHPFSEYPTAQLALVDDCSWFDEACLDGFDDEIRDVLSQNELLPEWFAESATMQFAQQLERVIEAKHERGYR